MAEGQKKRQVGKGMKPRGNKRFRTQKETNKVTNQSTNEGQVQGAPEPVLDPEVRNETPGNLEPENGSELLQNLEEKEAIVAQDSDVLEEPNEAGNDLLAALNESAGEKPQTQRTMIDGKEYFVGVDFASGDEIVVMKGSSELKNQADVVIEEGKVTKSREPMDMESAMAVGTGTVKGIKVLQEAYGSANFPDPPSEASVSMDIRGVPTSFHLGLQSDGTTKVVVTIQEGYFDAVTQWAEADGVSVESWLSDRLYEYISTYGEPAKGR